MTDPYRSEPIDRSGAPLAPDQLLPPVEPPSAGFILQLFVIPAVIVAGVVGVWLLIETLARRPQRDPEAIVAGLASSSQGRFQHASELANMLRMPQRYPEIRTDRKLAEKLAELLDAEVTVANPSEGEVTMRMIVCAMLGEFQIDAPLPMLLKAARTDAERDVRRKAINAIAVLAGSLGKLDPPQPLSGDELVEGLLALAGDEDPLIRSETAFALGVVAAATKAPDERLVDALVALADDPTTDARFNAARALARLGDGRAVKGLCEMFDPESLAASVSGEQAMTAEVTEQALRSQRAFKRNLIIHNAVQGVAVLAEGGKLDDARRKLLGEAMQKFLTSAESNVAAENSAAELAPLPKELLDAVRNSLQGIGPQQ